MRFSICSPARNICECVCACLFLPLLLTFFFSGKELSPVDHLITANKSVTQSPPLEHIQIQHLLVRKCLSFWLNHSKEIRELNTSPIGNNFLGHKYTLLKCFPPTSFLFLWTTEKRRYYPIYQPLGKYLKCISLVEMVFKILTSMHHWSLVCNILGSKWSFPLLNLILNPFMLIIFYKKIAHIMNKVLRIPSWGFKQLFE